VIGRAKQNAPQTQKVAWYLEIDNLARSIGQELV
jgi:hypothetical protein